MDFMPYAASVAMVQPAHLAVDHETLRGRTDGGQRPILKPHLSNQAKNVTSISHNENCPIPLAAMFFYRSGTFANSSQIYIKTNLFTKFHDDWANNVTSKNCPTPGSHVIQLTGTIFKLNSRIKKTNCLTQFYEKLGQKCDF
ncbi:hypothetical protein DPMN_003193 [Dreissena polymorpha]|uniref:Uncharacterized protein n=1 Tax=Dreissena polymorpha TaxID=45954 RepID=A0A9D4ML37_DREPO|nr:hypothetical protein DPMN_003193 [Dreissena polymorpha]